MAAQLETNGTTLKNVDFLQSFFISQKSFSLSPSGHFPAAGQVDVTLSKNNCGAVQR